MKMPRGSMGGCHQEGKTAPALAARLLNYSGAAEAGCTIERLRGNLLMTAKS